MTSLLAMGGSPKKVTQTPTRVKGIHIEMYKNLSMTYNGLHGEDACAIIFVPTQQLQSRL